MNLRNKIAIAGVVVALLGTVIPVVMWYLDKQEKQAEKEELAELAEACDATLVDLVIDEESRTDGGTKPNVSVTAEIIAPGDKFIYGPSLTESRTGTRHFDKDDSEREPHYSVADTDFSDLFLQSASYTVRCEHENIFGTSTCTATARLSAKLLPERCIPFLINKESEALTSQQ